MLHEALRVVSKTTEFRNDLFVDYPSPNSFTKHLGEHAVPCR
jgi:hypothetical protein